MFSRATLAVLIGALIVIIVMLIGINKAGAASVDLVPTFELVMPSKQVSELAAPWEQQ